MSFHLQPNIKHHQECVECGTSADDGLQLIETFIVATSKCEEGSFQTSAKKDLCAYCVVGQDVPVCRETQAWSFGEVICYNSKPNTPFLVRFLDGTEEWVDISRRPSLDYLTFVRSAAQSQQSVGAVANLNWLDKYRFNSDSLSTFSSSSSLGTFEPITTFGPSVFPLFNDDKLSNVENLAFVDEDVDMQDAFESKVLSDGIVTTAETTKTKTRTTRAPKHWTKEEDQLLVKAIDSFSQKGFKPTWPEVAKQVPNRNGKQCRERYVNHLSSALKTKIWDASEDALIVRAFFEYGTKWCQMTPLFAGRTDNGIKNRFHHLRRWLENDYKKTYSDEESMSNTKDLATAMRQKVQRMSADIATKSMGGAPSTKYEFGKLEKVKRVTQCKRCCLFAPSAQTGRSVCSIPGWCEACVSIATYVVGDDLRACLNKRMSLDDFTLE